MSPPPGEYQHPDPAVCRRVEDHLGELLEPDAPDAALSAAELDELRAEAQKCARCRNLLQTYSATVDLLRRLPSRPVPPGFLDRVRADLAPRGAARGAVVRARGLWRGLGFQIAAAAVLGFAAVLGWRWMTAPGERGEPLAARAPQDDHIASRGDADWNATPPPAAGVATSPAAPAPEAGGGAGRGIGASSPLDVEPTALLAARFGRVAQFPQVDRGVLVAMRYEVPVAAERWAEVESFRERVRERSEARSRGRAAGVSPAPPAPRAAAEPQAPAAEAEADRRLERAREQASAHQARRPGVDEVEVFAEGEEREAADGTDATTTITLVVDAGRLAELRGELESLAALPEVRLLAQTGATATRAGGAENEASRPAPDAEAGADGAEPPGPAAPKPEAAAAFKKDAVPEEALDLRSQSARARRDAPSAATAGAQPSSDPLPPASTERAFEAKAAADEMRKAKEVATSPTGKAKRVEEEEAAERKLAMSEAPADALSAQQGETGTPRPVQVTITFRRAPRSP